MEILTISLARNILKNESRDRDRMRTYANSVSSLHIIVLTTKEHDYKKEVHEGNLHVYPTHSRNRPLMLIDAFRIGKRIANKDRKQNLVISAQDPLSIGWISWLLSKTRNATLHIQVHGDYFSPYWKGKSILRLIQQLFILSLLKKTSNIRVVSERIKSSLIEHGIDESKIIVLPIRPELERFIAKQHTYKTNGPYTFLFVGRFSPEKDISRILSAFARVYETRKDITLQLVGEGKGIASITNFIKEKKLRDVVKVTGWTEDIPDVMANADVFLLASKHEAYGLVLLEAMAVGLPVISTDVGCVGEVVKDGIHGIIVKENGVDSYAEAIQKMLSDSDKMKSYGENGKKTAEKIAETSMDDYVNAWVNAMSRIH